MITTLAEVQKWANELDGRPGIVGPISNIGERYVEFHQTALARPSDVSQVESFVANTMQGQLAGYLGTGEGPIYWRIPFEYEIRQQPMPTRYDESGPDFDPVADRKCFMDHNWMVVKAYCRLVRAQRRMP